MAKHDLTPKELEQLVKGLLRALNAMPFYVGDILDDKTHKLYRRYAGDDDEE